ncbi:hypothetical protein AMQ84_16175 [Paenibacillus riograndensis]|uniref:Uncharacterized protein n=1 Tax=Paenibacillus riograndensis TaxID=483937 RepID=A0A132TXM7_9BACL|nr:hypothetical protein AMQ84_16175 [Paenibacillus riograndensis]
MAFKLVIIDSALNCITTGDRLWEGFTELSHNLLLAIMKLCSYELGQLSSISENRANAVYPVYR